jgi:hypothetical protein
MVVRWNRMRRTAVTYLLVFSSFALFVLLLLGLSNSPDTQQWLFPELGPAVLQDSYFYRGPALESPFGIIGDVPGGYSIYSGNPLGADTPSGLTDWMYGSDALHLGTYYPSLSTALLASVPFVFLVAVLLLLGRRSYGASKTH